MSSRDIIPSTDAEFVPWLTQLVSKIDSHASALAITTADINTLKADAAMVGWTFQVVHSLRASGQQFTSYKALLLDGHTGGPAQPAPAAPTFPAPPAAVPQGVVPRVRA